MSGPQAGALPWGCHSSRGMDVFFALQSQLGPFSGLPQSPPYQDSEGRQHEGQSQSWALDLSSPEGTGTSLGNSPCFWAMEGLGESLDLYTQAPAHEGGPTRGGSAGAACPGR